MFYTDKNHAIRGQNTALNVGQNLPFVKISVVCLIVILCLFGWLRFIYSRENPIETIPSVSSHALLSSSPHRAIVRTKSKTITVEPERTDNVVKDTLDELARRWDDVAKGSQGEALLAQQRELAQEAVAKLGGSDALLKFLDFLNERGAGDARDWILHEGAAALFSGPQAKEARDWLVTIEDRKLREQLCFIAGETFTGTGLKDFIASFHPDEHSESAVLTGYCRALAERDPDNAVKSFIALRPPGVDMSGLAQVMGSLAPTAEFARLSATLPDDSKTLARNARSALLESWAAAKPQDAAQYVIANSTLAHSEQMGVVVGTWANTAPDSAAAWIGALSPGAPRDEGTAALARHWASTNPSKAWEFAGQVGDFQKRVDTATGVFKEWEMTDREAATKAWVTLFPPAQ